MKIDIKNVYDLLPSQICDIFLKLKDALNIVKEKNINMNVHIAIVLILLNMDIKIIFKIIYVKIVVENLMI